MRAAFLFVLPLVALGSLAHGQENSPRPRLALDVVAPEILAAGMDGKAVGLDGLRSANAGKVIVIEFASITDPIFRAHVPTVEKNAAKANDKACYVIVYQKEAHPDSDPLEVNTTAGFNLPAPHSLAERQTLAQQAIEQLHITNETMLVDAWNNTTASRYGGLPNMTFVIDSKGILRGAYPFMDPAKVDAAVAALAAGKTLPEELRGSIQGSGPAPFDFSMAAADMTGGRGPASIAAALERSTLTDQQKQNLLVAIAEFMADAQNFRTARGNLPAAPARAGAPARGAAAGGGGAGATATKPAPTTPADVQAAQSTLKTAADRLKTVVKQNMNAKDAAALFVALDNVAPAQRLFTNQ